MKGKHFALLFIVSAGVSLSTWSIYGQRDRPPDKLSGSQFLTTVSRGNVEDFVLALGSLEPVTMVRVGAQVTGQIKAIRIKPGQSVKAGDLIAEIDAIPQENALRVAEATLKDVTAKLDEKQIEIGYAKGELDRRSKLSDMDVVSRTAYEEAESRYRTLLTQLSSLKAQLEERNVGLETARANLSYTRITAPIDGRVIAIPVQQGQTLNSAQTSPTIAVIADVSQMIVKLRISEADVERTRSGQRVHFTSLGNPRKVYEARLERVDLAPPTIGDESSREPTSETAKNNAVYYDAIAVVDNYDNELRTKMTVQARVEVGRVDNVVVVPWATLTASTEDGRHSLNIQNEDGTISKREVTIGLTDKNNAQIINGVHEGETVVLNAQLPNNGS